ncbi:MAG: nuclear transport factor 2 family protein [Aquaticitalea sp.]
MKTTKLFIALAFLSISTVFAQKKENGSIYIEHPAINVVQDFVTAMEKGDKTKIASYLTDDFKSYNGNTNQLNSKGMDKAAFVDNAMFYFENLDYYKMETAPGSYPDAIEIKKDNKDNEVTVQTWNVIRGVEKASGVKIDAGAHMIYTLTKDNKIKRLINYSNSNVIEEVRMSFVERTNGTIYNHHEYINTVRKMIYAFEKQDLEKAYGYYDDKAQFTNMDSADGKALSLTELKAQDKTFLDKFEIASIDMVGYPDYLHYELGDTSDVLSWWKYNLIRKSDKKAMTLPVHIIDGFNKEGKIISETAYYNLAILDQK